MRARGLVRTNGAATCKHVLVAWLKRLVTSGDVVFPLIMLAFAIQSLRYGDNPLTAWPVMLVIGCLWFVSARRSS